MKNFTLALLALLFILPSAVKADEGMWLLPFIKDKNIADMKKAGFKLSAEDIISINKHALKDAIVIFGGGCTGELISPSGLLITNHHCGYGSIQGHSSVEKDYLKNGFWAMNQSEEIPTPGLGVVFVKEIKDVTNEVLQGVTPGMSDSERAALIAKNSVQIASPYNKPKENVSARVAPMFAGNQYLLFVQERFGDVRLVGAPPSSIGKFGGETDNWMWPRHTGDFSIFRVYAADGTKSTSNYDPANKPYAAPAHLKVSTKGIKEGDYAMIIGFPGSTNRYMTSWEIDQVLEQDNPIRIYVRGEKQKLMMEDMLASDEVRIKYANKYAGSSNYWKNSIGMSRGLKRLNVKAKKEKEQAAFTAWVEADADRKAKYGQALTLIKGAVTARRPLVKETQLLSEVFNSVEFIPLATNTVSILEEAKAKNLDAETVKSTLKGLGQKFFKDYNPSTDQKVSKKLLAIYADYVPVDTTLKSFEVIRGDINGWVDAQFANSVFTDPARYNAFIENPSLDLITSDPAVVLGKEINTKFGQAYSASKIYRDGFARGQRLYLAGLLDMRGGKGMYPDANFTMRMTYGNVLPYKAADAVNYDYYTTLSGIMEKEDPTNPEFVVPAKLRELWEAKDFGPYAVNGDVPVAFLSNNDITGGNSGSPVMNAKGELLGLAFDGNWEAMSGDIAFEPALQRTISVDIRYVLFIIDKFAGAKHLIDEMTIAK